MTLDHTIAFVGAGNMAGALIRGLAEKQTIRRDRIVAADPDPTRLEALGSELGIRTTADNAEAVAGASVVVIATKPQVLPDALRGLAEALPADALVVSIAAGISTPLIERLLSGAHRVVRTMPNTPALVGAGATAIAGGTHATDDDLDLTDALFRSVGVCVRVPEAQLDAVTGLSGSGPAYAFAMIEALRDAGWSPEALPTSSGERYARRPAAPSSFARLQRPRRASATLFLDWRPRSEERSADPNHGRPLLDRRFEVVGHPHRELRQRVRLGELSKRSKG